MIKAINFQELIRKEYFEPDASRALIVTIALITPLSIALYLHSTMGVFVAITAQLISAAKIQGTYPQRAFVLGFGTIAVALASLIGTIAGNNQWLAIVLMALVAGVASFARGLGNHGQTLGLCAVVLFLISLHAPNTLEMALERAFLVFIGGAWASFLALLSWPLRPDFPFYITLAKPWEVSSNLMQLIARNPSGEEITEEELQKNELALNEAVNLVVPLLQQNSKNATLIRRDVLKIARSASRFGAGAMALQAELVHIHKRIADPLILAAIQRVAQAFSTAAHAISDLLINRNNATYAEICIQRAVTATSVLRSKIQQSEMPQAEQLVLNRIATLMESVIRYLRDAMMLSERLEKKKATISLIGSLSVGSRLATIWQKARLELQLNSTLFRHSLRVILVTALGMGLYFTFHIPRGYWIVITVMVLLQPDFATTRQKSSERFLGTFAGAICGTILLMYPMHKFLLLLAIGVCSFLFVYLQARNYKLSVVFVTIMLVAMLEISEAIDWHIAAYRLLATTIGGALSVGAVFLLWPNWERIQFPSRIAKAIRLNKNYLLQIGHELEVKAGFHARVIADRRKAELENQRILETIRRMSLEPGISKDAVENAQALAHHTVRLTRELTSFSAFLPGVMAAPEFGEAGKFIDACATSLEESASVIEHEESTDASHDFTHLLKEMEAQIRSVRSQFETDSENYQELGNKLLSYELIYSHLESISHEIIAIQDLTQPAKRAAIA